MLRAVALVYAWTVGGGIAIVVIAMLARDLRAAVRGWHQRRDLVEPSGGPRTPPPRPALARTEMRVIEPAEDQDEL